MEKKKLLEEAENKIALGNEGVCYILEDLIDSYTEELKKMIERLKMKDLQNGMWGNEFRFTNGDHAKYNQALDDIITELNHQ